MGSVVNPAWSPRSSAETEKSPERPGSGAAAAGTAGRAPSPPTGAPPFVEIGSKVTKGQVVCIVEAMKVMNEIECEIDGEVVEILVSNGQPVEFGEACSARS